MWQLVDGVRRRWLAALEAAVRGEGRPQFFLQASLVLMALNAAVFHFFPVASHDTRLNLLVCVGLLGLAILVTRPGWFVPSLHMALAVCAVLVVFISARTGGIQSQVLLWLCLVPLVALLLAGLVHGLVWLALVELGLWAIWRLTAAGTLSSEVPQGPSELLVLAGSLALCVLTPFLVAMLYDHLHRRRLAVLEEGNQALRNTHTALVQAQAHKDEFVAAVGHELRTPMSAILGLNAVLREHLVSAPEQLDAVEHIRRSTQQLLVVVNNILDFSQLQAGQLRLYPDWADARALVHSALEEQRSGAALRAVTLQCDVAADVPPLLCLDQQRFKQVLTNLLDNAVRYSPDGAQVHVALRWQAACLQVEVCDQGPGIEEERQPHIFSLFALDEDRNRRQQQGTGLGLAICQQLLSLQGGRIGVRSAKGEGACFWFDWPVPGASSVVSAEPQPTEWLAVLSVLVVDDDPVNRLVSALQIRKALPGARVEVAASAQEAQQRLHAERFGALVLDMHMPGMSGLDLVRWLRQQPAALSTIPVIGLTASTRPQDWESCLEAGMDGVLTKPLEPTRIVQLLARPRASTAGAAP